jgi:hypothetical protein
MLSLRSKIIVGIAVAILPALVLDYMGSLGSWAEPRAEDWYIGWIIFGFLAALAILSAVTDVRKAGA